MKRLLLSLALVVALIGFADPTEARNPDASELHWFAQQRTICVTGPCHESQQPHESINNTGCVWDIDDHATWWAQNGWINADATATGTDCLILDQDAFGHMVGVWVTSTSPDLVVSLDLGTVAAPVYPNTGTTFTPVWRPAFHDYIYLGCLVPYDVDPTPIVEGTNGGHGVRTDIIWSVTNPGSHRERGIYAQTEIMSNAPGHQEEYNCTDIRP
jgi:hypothetical protein